MPNGIVVRPRLASLALVAALAASSHVASATPTPRRALFQVQDTVAESVASISQAVADVADSTAQAVGDVETRGAEDKSFAREVRDFCNAYGGAFFGSLLAVVVLTTVLIVWASHLEQRSNPGGGG